MGGGGIWSIDSSLVPTSRKRFQFQNPNPNLRLEILTHKAVGRQPTRELGGGACLSISNLLETLDTAVLIFLPCGIQCRCKI